MNRADLQRLARLRLDDIPVLLGGQRWAAAYYLTGYAVECGLKACLLRHLGESASVFGDQGQAYLKKLAECWTHDLEKLVGLAGLKPNLGPACSANPELGKYWGITKDWNEGSRYEEKTETEAKALHEAVTHNPNGVFLWVQSRW